MQLIHRMYYVNCTRDDEIKWQRIKKKKSKYEFELINLKKKLNIPNEIFVKFNQRNEKFFPAFRTKRKQGEKIGKKKRKFTFFFLVVPGSGKNIYTNIFIILYIYTGDLDEDLRWLGTRHLDFLRNLQNTSSKFP